MYPEMTSELLMHWAPIALPYSFHVLCKYGESSSHCTHNRVSPVPAVFAIALETESPKNLNSQNGMLHYIPKDDFVPQHQVLLGT